LQLFGLMQEGRERGGAGGGSLRIKSFRQSCRVLVKRGRPRGKITPHWVILHGGKAKAKRKRVPELGGRKAECGMWKLEGGGQLEGAVPSVDSPLFRWTGRVSRRRNVGEATEGVFL